MPTTASWCCGGLGLGEAYPAVFGIGEAAAGHHIVGGVPGGPEDGVGGGDPAFHPGGLHEHRPAVDVTSGEDVLHIRAQVVVDRDHPWLGTHSRGVQRQVIDVGGPADGEEHGARNQLASCCAMAVVDVDSSTVGAERLDHRARMHVHALGAEGMAEFGGNAEIGGGYEGGPGLEQADGDTQVVQDRGDLAAGIGSADHGDVVGKGGQGGNVLVGQRKLSAGDRETARMTAHGQDDAVRRPGALVGGGDRVRVDETDRAEILNEVDSVPPEMTSHVLLVVGVPGHPFGVGHDGGKVRHWRRAVEAESGPGGPVARQAGRAGQRPHRRRAPVEAGATDLACFEQGDLRAKLAGLKGGGDPGWPPADHQQAARSAHVGGSARPPVPVGLSVTGSTPLHRSPGEPQARIGQVTPCPGYEIP